MSAEWAAVLVQVIYCLATLVLAAVAIWGGWARWRFERPRLVLELPALRGVLTSRNNGARVWYYHLEVVNKRPWSIARKCQVRCHRIRYTSPEGRWIEEVWPARIPLAWAWPNIRGPVVDIYKDDAVDFGFVDEGGEYFQLALQFRGNNLTSSIEGNRMMRADLTVLAEGTESGHQVVEIRWNGKWSENYTEMSRNVEIAFVDSW